MRLIKTARGRVTTEHGEDIGRGFLHRGIDIGHGDATAADLRLVAPAGGRVTAAGWDGTYGNRVIITHPDGTSSLIAHMARILVGVGDELDQGDDIGVMGSTGGPWAVHAHQEYRVDGIAVDPIPYMTATAGTPGTDLEEDDMFTDQDRQRLDAVYAGMFGPANLNIPQMTWAKPFGEKPGLAYYGALDIGIRTQTLVVELAGKLVAGKTATAEEIAAALAPLIDVDQLDDADLDNLARRIVDEQARRLTPRTETS